VIGVERRPKDRVSDFKENSIRYLPTNAFVGYDKGKKTAGVLKNEMPASLYAHFIFQTPPPPNTIRAHITPCNTPCNYTKTVGSNSIGKWVTFQNLGWHKCCTSLKITKHIPWHIIIVIKWMTFIQIRMLYWRYYTNFAGMLQITIFNESIFGKPCRWWNTHLFLVWLACTCLLFLSTIKECTWRKTPNMISYPTSTW
jgi:hypothetical protein